MWSIKCQLCRMDQWAIPFIRIDTSFSRHSSQRCIGRTIAWICDRVSSSNDSIRSTIIVVHDLSLSENSTVWIIYAIESCSPQPFLSLFLIPSMRSVVLCFGSLTMTNHSRHCAWPYPSSFVEFGKLMIEAAGKKWYRMDEARVDWTRNVCP